MVTADGHSWWWQLMINWQNNVPGHDNALPHHLPSAPPYLLPPPSCHFPYRVTPAVCITFAVYENLSQYLMSQHKRSWHASPCPTTMLHLKSPFRFTYVFNWQSNCSQRQCICTSHVVILFIMISVHIIIYNILFLYSNYSVTIESLLYMYACKCSHH